MTALASATGGNKTRKLEFVMADAIEQGADTIVTVGAVQSNHVRQTAAACCKLGLDCEVLLEHRVTDPSKNYAESGNVLLDRLFGANLREYPGGTDFDAAMEEVADEVRARGGTPVIVPGGASNRIGALGYVNCVLETLAQANQRGVKIDHWVTATGSAGTQAGLIVGLKAMHAGIPLLGIGVNAPKDKQEQKVFDLAVETAEYIGAPGVVERDDVIANCDYVGPGYGVPTEAMNEAVLNARATRGPVVRPGVQRQGACRNDRSYPERRVCRRAQRTVPAHGRFGRAVRVRRPARPRRVSELLADLEAIVGRNGLLTGDDVSARPAAWLHRDPTVARAIVRPRDTAETSAVLARCHAEGQRVVAVGGNTNLVDSTITGADDILLSFERMAAIEAVDETGSTMTAEAGVPLTRVHEAADELGFHFPVDFGARGSATIGGAISTNAGGNAVIRYGMMREQVLGLEAVLADGTVISSMNRMLKNNAGYDLKQLFIGTEGTLGIVTRAVLRLRPALSSRSSAFVAVDAYERIPTLLHRLGVELGGLLSAFEVLWADFYETVTGQPGRHNAPFAPEYPYYVLIESRGGNQAVDQARFQVALEGALKDGLIADAAIAESVAQRQAMWAIRDDIDGLFDLLDPVMAFDLSLPIGDAEAYAASVNRRLKERWPDIFRGTTFGHLGDGNLHFL